MPVPPTSISAATITSQAMPIEIRMPVRIVGAAERGIEQHRPHRADENDKNRRDRGILDGVERKRHPGERRDRLEDLDERIERLADQRRHPDQKAEWNGNHYRQQI